MTEIIPPPLIHPEIANIITTILLADAKFNAPRQIDLFLGAECFFIYAFKSGQIRSSSENLLLQETIFRYVINNCSTDSQNCGLLFQK